MTHKPRNAHPVPVRIVYTAKKRTTEEKNSQSLEIKKPVEVIKNTSQAETSKITTQDFVKPKEKRKLLSFLKIVNPVKEFLFKFKIRVTILVLIIVVVGGGLAFLMPRVFYHSSIPSFLPENTIFFAAMSVDPLNRDLRALVSDLKKPASDINAPQLLSDITSSGSNTMKGIDLKAGLTKEAGVAFFHGDEGVTKVIILHIPDPQNAQSLLEKVAVDQNVEEKDYKGFKVVTMRNKDDSTKASSYLYAKNYAFIATGSTTAFTLADVIQKDQPSLSQNEAYKKLSSQSRSMAMGRAFLDVSKISQLQGLVTLPSITGTLLPLLDNQSIYGSFYEKQGALAYDLVFERDQVEKKSMEELLLTPVLVPTTLAAFEGKNFVSDWNNFETTLTNSQPLLAFYFSNIQKRLRDSFEFDVVDDFLKHFDKEYVLAVDETTSRSKNTGKPFQNFSLVLVLKNTKAFTDAEPQLQEKLKNILSSQFRGQAVSLTQESYVDLTLNVFSGEGMPVNIYYVVHDDKVMISTTKSFFSNVNTPSENAVSDLSAYPKLSAIKSGTTLHTFFVNTKGAPEDLVPGSLRDFTDGMLVRDSQKGDNAVITGYIHLTAK